MSPLGGFGMSPGRLLRGARYAYRMALVRLLYPRVRLRGRVKFHPGVRFRLAGRGRVEIGPGCEFDIGLTVECRGVLTIGAGTFCGHHCTLAALQRITIGRDCLLAELVSVRDHDHRFADLAVPVRDQGQV